MEQRKAVYNPKADKKWIEKNKEHRSYLSQRSTTRSFIRKKATADDLTELEKLIEESRINENKNEL